MNWLLISCIASFVIAMILAFVLGAFWLADRADEITERQLASLADEADRIVRHGDQHPWTLR